MNAGKDNQSGSITSSWTAEYGVDRRLHFSVLVQIDWFTKSRLKGSNTEVNKPRVQWLQPSFQAFRNSDELHRSVYSKSTNTRCFGPFCRKREPLKVWESVFYWKAIVFGSVPVLTAGGILDKKAIWQNYSQAMFAFNHPPLDIACYQFSWLILITLRDHYFGDVSYQKKEMLYV